MSLFGQRVVRWTLKPNRFLTVRLPAATTTTTTTTCRLSSNKNNVEKKNNYGGIQPVYIHPLSQLVLQCLQNHHGDWWLRRRLHVNHNLTVKPDGTFELEFSLESETVLTMSGSTQRPSDVQESSSTSPPPTTTPKTTTTPHMEHQHDRGRIWTSFDNERKKHWLSISYRHGLVQGHYMLQDNLRNLWTNQRQITPSLPERIEHAVNEMVQAMELAEQKYPGSTHHQR